MTNQFESANRIAAEGDLECLDPKGRCDFYMAVCESVGLNPLTRPLEYIELNGKLTLYAKRGATDQLRRKHHVSIEIVDRAIQDEVYIVRARALTPDGRTDESLGAVSLAGLAGDDLANALMKAETKAKRRVALSICGLGMLDETEVDTIRSRASVPNAAVSTLIPSTDDHSSPTAATLLRAWDDRYPESRDALYAHVKQGYGKRVLGLAADEVLEVLDWIAAYEPTPSPAGDRHDA